MKWVEFVKSYCSRHGISYKEALKNVECKEQYHKQKGEEKEVETGNKIFKKKQETNKLLNFGSETIEIPREMALDNKVVPTLTASKTIRKRNKQPAVNIEPTEENHINVITNNKPHEEQFNEFKTELKTRRRGRKMLSGMKDLMI